MSMFSRRWLMISSIGHGLLFGIAMSGLVRIVGDLAGTPVSEVIANRVFTGVSLVAMPLAVYFRVAELMVPAALREQSK